MTIDNNPCFPEGIGKVKQGIDMEKGAYFGFEAVSGQEKTERVRDVFHRVAKTYDLMNDLMSLGIHRLWKDHLVWNLNLPSNATILDVAGGTGDISFRLQSAYPHLNLSVTVCDLTPAMVEAGRDRALDQGITQGINWVCGNAENLPLPDGSIDLYVIAYGLRNVTHIDRALAEAFRVLKDGGKFVCLEFSHMTSLPLQQVYDAYSFRFLPLLGKWVAKDQEAYQYLVESIRQFPNQETLADMMGAAGFPSVKWENLWQGISCIHTSVKQS